MHSCQIGDITVGTFRLQELKGACVGCQEKFPSSEQKVALSRLIESRRLLLWDFDGTYCDSEPVHFRAYNEAFAHFGHQVAEEEYYVRFTQGEDGAADECAAYSLELDLREVKRLKAEAFRRRINRSEVLLFPEMVTIVSSMRDLGLRWMVVSNSLEEDVRQVLNQHSQTHSLPECVIGPAPGLRKKPEPDLFLHALDVSGCSPDQALVIEDTDKGLKAAQAAGVAALWVQTRYNANVVPRASCVARVTHSQLAQALSALQRSQQ